MPSKPAIIILLPLGVRSVLAGMALHITRSRLAAWYTGFAVLFLTAAFQSRTWWRCSRKTHTLEVHLGAPEAWVGWAGEWIGFSCKKSSCGFLSKTLLEKKASKAKQSGEIHLLLTATIYQLWKCRLDRFFFFFLLGVFPLRIKCLGLAFNFVPDICSRPLSL